MGTHLILFGRATEIALTLIGFCWERDMLKALAIGIDERFAQAHCEMQRFGAELNNRDIARP